MNVLSAPLVPAEVDLRGFEWMPYYGNHLLGSDFIIAASDAEFRAAHLLWWAAWNQQPASSLPDNERALAHFAGLGKDLRTFRKVREVALHGFIKCTDGRLYHKFQSKLALRSWAEKQDRDIEREKWKIHKRDLRDKWRKNNKEIGKEDCPLSQGTSTETVNGSLVDVHDIIGQDRIEEDDSSLRSESSAPHANEEGLRDGYRRGKGRSGRGTRLPADWQPDAADREFACGLGLDPVALTPEFRDYWCPLPGSKGCKLDWSATWRNRCRDLAGRRQVANGGRGGREADGLVAALREIRSSGGGG